MMASKEVKATLAEIVQDGKNKRELTSRIIGALPYLSSEELQLVHDLISRLVSTTEGDDVDGQHPAA